MASSKKKTNNVEISKTKSKAKKNRNMENKKPKISNDNTNQQDEGFKFAFPMNRIRTIVKCKDANMRVSQEALLAINTAAKFIEQFVHDAYTCCVQDGKRSLTYDHLANVVSKERRYDFLSDFVPEKVKAEEALRELQQAKGDVRKSKAS